jgi:hypothetical protein
LSELIYRHTVVGLLVATALLVPLWRHRGEFAALPDPRSRRRALVAFIVMAAGSVGLGLVIVSLHARHMIGHPSLFAGLERFQIQSLYKFNAKFQPRWEPRFMVRRCDLPRIGVTAMRAEGLVDLFLPASRMVRHGAAAESARRRLVQRPDLLGVNRAAAPSAA